MRRYIDPLLARGGIDTKRYWLLLELFRTLSRRQELMGQHLGNNGPALWLIAFVYGGLLAFVALLFVNGEANCWSYLRSFTAMTVFMSAIVLMTETSNTLVNPVEGLALAHHPINGATYTAAKLTHLGRVVLFLAVLPQLVPACAGLALATAPLYYPLLHVAAAAAVGVTVALGCCAVFGWLLRFVPASRIKLASQVLTAVILLATQVNGSSVFRMAGRWLDATGPRMLIAVVVAAVLAIAFGLRSLSADYLTKAHRLVQGGSRRTRTTPRQWGVGALVARFAGGPAARAGFAYVASLSRRDWQFLRGATAALPALPFLVTILYRSPANPFTSEWSGFLLIPHLLGLLAFTVCTTMRFGAQPDAKWVFLLAPGGAFPRFARGVFVWVALALAVLPHLLMFPLVLAIWPWRDACLFVAFSFALSLLYCAVSLGFLDGIPFGAAQDPGQSATLLPVMFAGLILAGMAVVLEMYLFRSPALVAVVTLMATAAAVWQAQAAIGSLSAAMRFHLDREIEKGLYSEVAA